MMTYFFKRGAVLLVSLLLASVVCAAAASPLLMLEGTSEQMIEELQQNKTNLKQNPKLVYSMAKRIILPHVDIRTMSRLALGRENWGKATPEQRKLFQKEFSDLVIRTYATALASYSDESVKFKPIRGDIGERKRIQIDSLILQRGGPSIPVSYRLLLKGNEWKVYDIMVDGVSMIQSFRSQFSSEISRGGVEGLLSAMQQHANKT